MLPLHNTDVSADFQKCQTYLAGFKRSHKVKDEIMDTMMDINLGK